jgi:alcohol dehydrogenase
VAEHGAVGNWKIVITSGVNKLRINSPIATARNLLKAFKGDSYRFGLSCFDELGNIARSCGTHAAVVASGTGKAWGAPVHEAIDRSLAAAGVKRVGPVIPGARPNTPREDVFRIARALSDVNPEFVVAAGGGSLIDAVKGAIAWNSVCRTETELDALFGMGKVSEHLTQMGKRDLGRCQNIHLSMPRKARSRM